MTEIPSVNSDQQVSPTPANQDHKLVTTSSSKDVIVSSDSTQAEHDLSYRDNELPPTAQKIVDAFMQSDVLDAEKEQAIPSVCSSSSGSSSTDNSSADNGGETGSTSSSSQGQASSTSSSTDNEEEQNGLTSKEQKFVDACLSSDHLSDKQKASISERPEDFMNLLVEPEVKNARKNKQEQEDRNQEIADNASYNPEKEADTTLTTKSYER